MPRRSLLRTAALIVALACASAGALTPAGTARAAGAQAAELRERAALRQQLGRLVFTGFFGTTAGEQTRGLLRDVGVRGLILHSSNVRSREQLLALTKALRRQAGHPIFISVTQETGVVDHLNGIFPDLPSPPELASKQPAASRTAGCRMGVQLRSVGIDVDFAPVLDVIGQPGAYIGSRSFGSDPEVVASRGAAFVRGLQRAGVFAVVKHFPGNGWVKEDPHEVLPVDPRPLWKLRQRDLSPYGPAFDAGASATMIGHVKYSKVDPDFPASLSSRISTGILRDELGFEGLAITDALGMGALGAWPIGQRAVNAVVAGADMVLLSLEPDSIPTVVAALRKAFDRGIITKERARDAVDHLDAALARAAQLRNDAQTCAS